MEPVDRLYGFNLRPEKYSYMVVSGTVRVSIPTDETVENTPQRAKESIEIETESLQDSPFFTGVSPKNEVLLKVPTLKKASSKTK